MLLGLDATGSLPDAQGYLCMSVFSAFFLPLSLHLSIDQRFLFQRHYHLFWLDNSKVTIFLSPFLSYQEFMAITLFSKSNLKNDFSRSDSSV